MRSRLLGVRGYLHLGLSKGGTAILTARRPCRDKCLYLCSERLEMARAACGGGGGQPLEGPVVVHLNLCSSVPTASRHSWHRLSSMPEPATAAFLAWVHCPPLAAEARSPLWVGFQRSRTSPAHLGQGLPLTSVLMADVHGTRMDLCLAVGKHPTSRPGGQTQGEACQLGAVCVG